MIRLKKVLKVFAWITGVLLLVLTSIIFLIQTDYVQNKILKRVTAYLASKTHTKIEIGHIRILFPKTISITGIYLEDERHDTLLYAGELAVNLDMMALINKDIHVKEVILKNTWCYVNRSERDSLYNFNFLIDAFSGDKSEKTVEDSSGSGELQIDRVSLQRIFFSYDDKYGRTKADLALGFLDISIDKLDLEKSFYNISDFTADGMNVKVITGIQVKDSTDSKTILPHIFANNFSIKNSSLSYTDGDHMKIKTALNDLRITKADLNLDKEIVNIRSIMLSQSRFEMDSRVTDKISPDSTEESPDWNVRISELKLADNSFQYHTKDSTSNSFDAGYLDYSGIGMEVKDIIYSSTLTSCSIKSMTAKDRKDFAIVALSGIFKMTDKSIVTKDLKIETAKSSIKANTTLSFNSIKELGGSIQNLEVLASFENCRIHTADILFFSPQLADAPFLKGGYNSLDYTGDLKGRVDDLSGNIRNLQTASSTIISSGFKITGLPDAKKAYFSFPSIEIVSGKKDLDFIFAGQLIPANVQLPEKFSINMEYFGMLNDFKTEVILITTAGNANVTLSLNQSEEFEYKLNTQNIDLGYLLKNKSLGPLTVDVDGKGKGLSKETLRSHVSAQVNNVYFNKYTYRNLSVNGDFTAEEFKGNIALNDTNAVFNFDGLVNFSPDNSQYKFLLDVKGVDLQKLNLAKEDLRLSGKVFSDLIGNDLDHLNGEAGIAQLIVVKDGEKYPLDSLLFASVNEKGKNSLSLKSAIASLKYDGTFAPGQISNGIKKHLNQFFPLIDPKEIEEIKAPQNFTLELNIKNHPVIAGVLLPELKAFDYAHVNASFDSEASELNIEASLNSMNYNDLKVDSLNIIVNSDKDKLTYNLSCKNLYNEQIKLENFIIDGSLSNNIALINVSSKDKDQVQKLLLNTQLMKVDENYKLRFDPSRIFLSGEQWILPSENYIVFGKSGFNIHHIDLANKNSKLMVSSVDTSFASDIKIKIENFSLASLFKIVAKDTVIATGEMNADILLKPAGGSYGIVAEGDIADLSVRKIKVGQLKFKAGNSAQDVYAIQLSLKEAGNDLLVSGTLSPKEINPLNFDIAVNSLTLKTAEAFSMGQLKEGGGTIDGKLKVTGAYATPEINGYLHFNEAFIKPTALNNRLNFKNEKISISPDAIDFNKFMIYDETGNLAQLNGKVLVKEFKNFRLDLRLNSNNFLLFNTTVKDNKMYYGKLIIDSDVKLSGPVDYIKVDANVKLKKGSSFTVAVPEKKLDTDRGEGVVLLTDSGYLHPILLRDKEVTNQETAMKGFDITSAIQVDKEASFKLLIDPSSKDSLVVKGSANLNFSLDPSGKMSLTGNYNLVKGSYVISIQSLVHKKFDIQPGSTIYWNGDVMDADINITAIYKIKTSPVDLVAGQLSGYSEAETNSYKQTLPFLVKLKLTGELTRPEINFEITLPPEERGALNGAVYAKLNQLNEDQPALNKQVFALLVLGRFVQENPFNTGEGSDAEAVARTSVSRFLTQQLNQFSAKKVKGVELNFDIESRDDYSSGSAEGRTAVGVGVKKQLFNDRLSVQVGSTVDVEGEKAQQNNLNTITGDAVVEYKLTKDGRYKLKGFRQNQYENLLEGQIIETGGGVVYTRDFDFWKEFFRKPSMDKKK